MTDNKDKEHIKSIDLNADHSASWERVEQLRRGRSPEDIHTSDEYWKALKKHQAAYQKGTLK